jgi:hypothetical protein
MAYTHGRGFGHFLRIKKELVEASPNIRSNDEPRSLSKWTLMSTTARWAEPTACLNGRTEPFVRSGPLVLEGFAFGRSAALVTDLDENTIAG